MKKTTTSKIKSYLVTALPLLLFQIGCAKVTFGTQTDLSSIQAEGMPASPGSTAHALKTLQPTLAVRGMACLMCHADVRANIITDFGYGDSFFMGGNINYDKDQSWYSNMASSWQTSSGIQGTIYVPDVAVTQNAKNALGSAYSASPLMKIADFMAIPYVPGWNYDGNGSSQAMISRVTPSTGNVAVVGKTSIKIRAPIASEIRALAPSVFSGGAAFARVGSTLAVQLLIQNNGQGNFVTNDPSATLQCADSDIVINGPLFLKNLKVSAAGGCRLYVVGSVFIEGAITYDAGTKPNLQITSTRAISMGISETRLAYRLQSDYRGLQLSSSLSYSDIASATVADAKIVGTMKDAQDDYSPRASIDFSGLLLNAPIIHSRYLGQVKGTIIAEAALFALGAFHFEYDDVFTEVSVFPLLSNPVLSVQ